MGAGAGTGYRALHYAACTMRIQAQEEGHCIGALQEGTAAHWHAQSLGRREFPIQKEEVPGRVRPWLHRAKVRSLGLDSWACQLAVGSAKTRHLKYTCQLNPVAPCCRMKVKPDGTVKKIMVGCPPEDLAWDPATQAGQVFIAS